MEFEYHNTGNDEAAERKALSYLLSQISVGRAAGGILAGLGVTQTATASESVNIAAGACVVQQSASAGASLLVNDTDPKALDVLIANPVGGLPRWDLIVFDQATLSGVDAGGSGGLRVVVGTPNASPSYPSAPATATVLAGLKHTAGAVNVPSSAIDTSMRAYTSLGDFGAWTNINLGSGVAGTLKYRLRGSTVDLVIDVTGSFGAGFTAASAAGAIPSTARPPDTPARCIAYVGSGTVMGSIEVTTGGTVNVQVQAGTAGVAKTRFSYPVG